MSRTPLGIIILAGMILILAGPTASSLGDDSDNTPITSPASGLLPQTAQSVNVPLSTSEENAEQGKPGPKKPKDKKGPKGNPPPKKPADKKKGDKDRLPEKSRAVEYTVVDMGYYSLGYGCGQGGMGECFPVLTPVWVPCPVLVPINPHDRVPDMHYPKDRFEPQEKFGPKKDKKPGRHPELAPTGDGPDLPNINTPSSVVRTVSTNRSPSRTVSTPYSTKGLRPTDAFTLYNQGRKLYYAGHYSEALRRFNAAISLYTEDARFWYFKSLSEAALSDAISSKKSLTRAVELHLQGKPDQAHIGASLERIQGEARMYLRAAYDAKQSR